ncbi:hypothetical protein AAA799N04_00532 [Marine Group I thaumarchaeote SCGC AAA799-N04]|uniref:Uncharacterized protein n=1 Tax=Marine Group I thaumarchaeote SCGC AAA799-N04 TaxID=1502293 RepID=A0A081RNT9_9ARCH|nr:hypothetical protein AAA799N04_00532 [Marine Group I thaumarchaeote SCGC AAA799-N04]
MEKRNLITVRDVNEQVLRRFKAKIAANKMKMGQALTQAMKQWIEKEEEKSESINVKILSKTKSFDWGKGTEMTSKQIDEILY